MITKSEILSARRCISIALKNGASAVRVTLNKSVSDTCTILNSELDKVAHSADRSVYLCLYVDGRYGTFSTNRLGDRKLEDFIMKAVAMVRMLGEDGFRRLPEPERTAKDAVTGKELGLYDESYGTLDTDARLAKGLGMSIYASCAGKETGYRVISEECEFTDSFDDTYIIDSQGFEGRHTETSFSAFTEITIEDTEGCKYSGYWWEGSPFLASLSAGNCGPKALEKAASQIGTKARRGGRYRMVVDTTVSSRLISPIFAALNASSIQQKMSFLDGSIGKKIFPDGLTVMDLARTRGAAGARLFDSEGVATKDSAVIENGVVKQYFVNTYMAGKMQMEPTVEDISRPCVMPYLSGKHITPDTEISMQSIMKHCRNGILVTGFNGGNCNPTTGDFSFGVEGFAFSRGKITHPVREMLITGNLTDLWNHLIAAGTDARPCTRWQIPTLAFSDVSFSA